MNLKIWLGMAASLYVASVTGSAAGQRDAVFELQPIDAKQWRAAGVGGTGCWWRSPRDAGWRLAMSDNRAVTVIMGKVVMLRPAPGAKPWFPFTYDRWESDAVQIDVRSKGVARQTGRELQKRTVQLTVSRAGARRSVVGVMVCGS